MSAEPYYRGRSDYRDGKVIPPREYTTIERAQWDCGHHDEHCKNPDPIHISAVRNVVYAYREGRAINPTDIDTLEHVADALARRRH